MNKTSITTIDDYISQFPKNVQTILNNVRKVVAAAAPKATKAIKYGIPTFVQNGNLVHFGGFKNHIGFYPTPNGTLKFKKELAKYEIGKGSIKFPLDQPIPYILITKIVKFRVKETK